MGSWAVCAVGFRVFGLRFVWAGGLYRLLGCWAGLQVLDPRLHLREPELQAHRVDRRQLRRRGARGEVALRRRDVPRALGRKTMRPGGRAVAAFCAAVVWHVNLTWFDIWVVNFGNLIELGWGGRGESN